jgi:hypothetical protein
MLILEPIRRLRNISAVTDFIVTVQYTMYRDNKVGH